MTVKQLEREAARAGRAGMTWSTWWERHGDHVRALEPFHRERFHRLHRRLLVVLMGSRPTPPAPWELPDEAGNRTNDPVASAEIPEENGRSGRSVVGRVVGMGEKSLLGGAKR